MRIGDLIASHIQRFFYQRPFSHLGAQGTGIALFTLLKHDLSDLSGDNLKLHAQFPGKFFYALKIRPFHSQIHADCTDRERLGIKRGQP